MRFSQRQGITPASKTLQVGAIDADLRNGLWDCVQVTYFDSVEYEPHRWGRSKNCDRRPLLIQYWHGFFKLPVDTIPENFEDAVGQVRDFFFAAPWHAVYDFLEFTADVETGVDSSMFRKFCNRVLERENAGYRFVDAQIAEITSRVEVEAIDEALTRAGALPGVKLHLERALSLLADRKSPDYRNSIKESISAVEALAIIVAGKQGAGVGEALAILEQKGALHGGLKRAFAALYGYTSDADGIRHAALAEPNVTLAEAKFMLVACSAFVFYVIGKAAELNLPLKDAT